MSTNKNDEARKDEINGDSLEKVSSALTGMSVMATARSEKRYDVASASLLTSLKAGDERLNTDAVNLTQQTFAAQGYQP
jgi:hypothetical protein